MTEPARPTIFALSTPPGRAGVAVLRISGPATAEVVARLLGGPLPSPRRAQLATLRWPGGEGRGGEERAGEAIDRGLVLWFPGPGSYTGEDMAELHLHGSRAVVAAALDCLGAEGLRLAEPGEFTRRAFDNGKLDLSAAEGLADLIDAETEAQRRQALGQALGALAEVTEAWRDRAVAALAHIEAAIDFPDEDLPDALPAEVRQAVAGLAAEVADCLAQRGGERLRAGYQVVLLGPPNSGKSSLLNALARRDAAIVSETAGTTRDVIEVHLDLGGYPVTLIDTAGLREAGAGPQEAIEREGIRRALARAGAADLQVAVFDATATPEPAVLGVLAPEALVVLNKVDLAPAAVGAVPSGQETLRLSALTGENLEGLIGAIERRARRALGAGGESPLVTRARHREALEACAAALGRGAALAEPELMAEELRGAVQALGRITGRVDVEDVLDLVFRDFCIGK